MPGSQKDMPAGSEEHRKQKYTGDDHNPCVILVKREGEEAFYLQVAYDIPLFLEDGQAHMYDQKNAPGGAHIYFERSLHHTERAGRGRYAQGRINANGKVELYTEEELQQRALGWRLTPTPRIDKAKLARLTAQYLRKHGPLVPAATATGDSVESSSPSSSSGHSPILKSETIMPSIERPATTTTWLRPKTERKKSGAGSVKGAFFQPEKTKRREEHSPPSSNMGGDHQQGAAESFSPDSASPVKRQKVQTRRSLIMELSQSYRDELEDFAKITGLPMVFENRKRRLEKTIAKLHTSLWGSQNEDLAQPTSSGEESNADSRTDDTPSLPQESPSNSF